jgi:hypothetical protein
MRMTPEFERKVIRLVIESERWLKVALVLTAVWVLVEIAWAFLPGRAANRVVHPQAHPASDPLFVGHEPAASAQDCLHPALHYDLQPCMMQIAEGGR